jgi:hypothetical protein
MTTTSSGQPSLRPAGSDGPRGKPESAGREPAADLESLLAALSEWLSAVQSVLTSRVALYRSEARLALATMSTLLGAAVIAGGLFLSGWIILNGSLAYGIGQRSGEPALAFAGAALINLVVAFGLLGWCRRTVSGFLEHNQAAPAETMPEHSESGAAAT